MLLGASACFLVPSLEKGRCPEVAGPSSQGVPFLQMVLPRARGLDKPQPEGSLLGVRQPPRCVGCSGPGWTLGAVNFALLPFRVCAIDPWLALLCAPSELPVGRN